MQFNCPAQGTVSLRAKFSDVDVGAVLQQCCQSQSVRFKFRAFKAFSCSNAHERGWRINQCDSDVLKCRTMMSICYRCSNLPILLSFWLIDAKNRSSKSVMVAKNTNAPICTSRFFCLANISNSFKENKSNEDSCTWRAKKYQRCVLGGLHINIILYTVYISSYRIDKI